MEDVLNKVASQIKWEEDEGHQFRVPERSFGRDLRPPRRSDRPLSHPDRPPRRQETPEPYQRNFRSRPIVNDVRPNRRIPEYVLSISPTECVYALKDLGNAVRWS